MARMVPASEHTRQERVIVGLSGGVDSAVTALLLRQRGYDVQGLHMTNWDDDDDGYCTAAQDLQDARQVAGQIGIPLHHANFASDYRERVFQHFLDEYAAGRTPNPDVLCNREIKFGVFRRYAARLGATRVATGHYARLEHGADGPVLKKGLDINKDQSYFLHAVDASALDDALFPLGDYAKPDVRQLARDHGLAPRDKKDSTGICFIGERPFREFLSRYLPAQPGPIVTPEGQRVGEHAGLMYYTLGQRQGLRIGGRADAGHAPWYVADKRLADNALVVVQGDHALLYSSAISVTDCHWIGTAFSPGELAAGIATNVKLRYRQPDQLCRVRSAPNGRLLVDFERPQRAVAPGQYAVFYAGDRCLGGGVIETICRHADARRSAS